MRIQQASTSSLLLPHRKPGLEPGHCQLVAAASATALGLHPELAGERISELALFEYFANQTSYFGEIGLAGSPQLKPFYEAQAKVFDTVLGFAARLGGRILSIHSRRATEEVLDALASHPNAGTPVLHWFSGSQVQLRRAIATRMLVQLRPCNASHTQRSGNSKSRAKKTNFDRNRRSPLRLSAADHCNLRIPGWQ